MSKENKINHFLISIGIKQQTKVSVQVIQLLTATAWNKCMRLPFLLVQEKEVVKGVVVGITDREVILNIGFKSDGIVSSNEFS
ncbi:hypothetical protein PEC18_39605 [Paucibacter sp. O1-1]|nr:hypothetical protein [Paucibacter sp. O1-1]MDA3831717.1 hypothetical protein [Paucibacter sp. O1-1]